MKATLEKRRHGVKKLTFMTFSCCRRRENKRVEWSAEIW